ncbi:MAG: TonB-dependent receptor [Olivibacter sp.]|nr:TonB-dependent receptor [Olivibacter sp. UJ_SKK_5.1]
MEWNRPSIEKSLPNFYRLFFIPNAKSAFYFTLFFSFIASMPLCAQQGFSTGDLTVVEGQQERGIITGRVETRDGEPAEAVTISVSGAYTVKSDPSGYFKLDGVRPGTHTLTASYVGLQVQRRTINVVAGESVKILITLVEDAQALQEVVVSSEVGAKIVDKETEYVARMPLSNLENPQVYNVIPKELMKEQVAVDIGAVMRNAPGSVPQIYASGGFGITTRGFNSGINARNGMETTSGRSSLDIANVERIEVLKGPSGTLFGAAVSSFGGVVNLVTKKPLELPQTELSYTTGSYNLNRLSVDFNRPLNADKTVLFRLNTAVNRQKSFLNYGFNNTFLLAPSLTYKMNERLTFQFDAEYFHTNNTRIAYNTFQAASGITGSSAIPLDYRTSLFNEDLDAKTKASKFFAEANYKLSESWTSSTVFSYVGEDVDYSNQYYLTWTGPTQVARSVSRFGPIYNNYTNVQQNFNGKFRTGSIGHNLLVGANYRYYRSRFIYGSTGVLDVLDVSKPFTAIARQAVDTTIKESPFPVADQEVISAYASDVVQWTDRLSTMLSLRIDHFNRKSMPSAEGYTQTALAPKFGLVYQVLKNRLSVFGNYMSGFQNLQPALQPNGTQLVLDPVQAFQSEGGVKMELMNKKLNLTASYYHIIIDNATRVDTAGYTIQDGEQVSKGMELELIANPIRGLHLVAGYVYNDNRIIKASDATIEGNKAVGAPENVVNFWASYTFHGKLNGFGLGLGANYVDRIYPFQDNVFVVPSYTLLDASVFYQQPKWRLGFKLNNISNERYWDAWSVPQAPRNAAVNLTLRF